MTVLQYSNPKSAEKANNVIAYSLTPTKNLLVETNLVLSLCPFTVFFVCGLILQFLKNLPEDIIITTIIYVLFGISTMTYLSSL
jgi:hypothetical protein